MAWGFALVTLAFRLCGASLDQGLLAHYPFIGNANDASPNGNHGTVSGARLGTDRYGRADQAYLFDGVDDMITIGNRVKPNFPITVTAWIFPTVPGSGSHTIFRTDTFDTSASVHGIVVGYHELGFLYTYIGSGPFTGNTYRSWITSTMGAIPGNTWTHIAVEWIGFDSMKFFVNGLQVPGRFDGTGSGTTIVNTTANGAIGRLDNPAAASPFTGRLDEIRVYDRALDPDEVRALAVDAPEVTVRPSSLTTNAGTTAVFTADAVGATPLSYAWQFNGTLLAGRTGSTLTLTNLQASQSGTYRVVVTNPVGTNSAQASLTVIQQAGAFSSFPPVFTNGVPFTVSLQVIPPAGAIAYALQDQPPVSWAVSQISSGGSFSGGRVRWVFGNADPRVLSYVLTPPASVSGDFPFSGVASFSLPGGGTTNVTVTGVRSCYNETLRLSAGWIELLDERYVRLTVAGKPGTSCEILVADTLEPGTLWRSGGTVTLTAASADWVDTEPMVNPRRFYRARTVP